MPTYQYACIECGHQLEAVQSFTDAALTECTVCHGRLRKVFGSVGVVFKGSGFYRTDSRNGGKSGGSAGPGAPGTSGAEKKAENTPAANGSSSSDSAKSSSASSSSGSSSSGSSSSASSSAPASSSTSAS